MSHKCLADVLKNANSAAPGTRAARIAAQVIGSSMVDKRVIDGLERAADHRNDRTGIVSQVTGRGPFAAQKVR
jgi:hypothetical protein